MKRETIEALIASYIYTQNGTGGSGEERKFENAGGLQGRKLIKEFFSLSGDRHTEKIGANENSSHHVKEYVSRRRLNFS